MGHGLISIATAGSSRSALIRAQQQQDEAAMHAATSATHIG
jgi:hypothetical protein